MTDDSRRLLVSTIAVVAGACIAAASAIGIVHTVTGVSAAAAVNSVVTTIRSPVLLAVTAALVVVYWSWKQWKDAQIERMRIEREIQDGE